VKEEKPFSSNLPQIQQLSIKSLKKNLHQIK